MNEELRLTGVFILPSMLIRSFFFSSHSNNRNRKKNQRDNFFPISMKKVCFLDVDLINYLLMFFDLIFRFWLETVIIIIVIIVILND